MLILNSRGCKSQPAVHSNSFVFEEKLNIQNKTSMPPHTLVVFTNHHWRAAENAGFDKLVKYTSAGEQLRSSNLVSRDPNTRKVFHSSDFKIDSKEAWLKSVRAHTLGRMKQTLGRNYCDIYSPTIGVNRLFLPFIQFINYTIGNRKSFCSRVSVIIDF